jgi:hypothetical protein
MVRPVLSSRRSWVSDQGLTAERNPWHCRRLGNGESVGNEEFCTSITLDSDKLMDLLPIPDYDCLAVGRLMTVRHQMSLRR